MKTYIKHTDERGFSLVEMIIAILIYGIVLAAGIGFVATQNKMFHRGMDRMTALQNLRYAFGSLETDIVAMGTNVPNEQPSMVYAGKDVMAFSADYASNVENDIFAAYIDVDAPTGQVTAPGIKFKIPNTSFSWPDTLYRTNANTRSPAELIIFWFYPDTSTTRTDDYILYRQVNNAAAEPLTGNLLAAADGSPFFRYFRRIDYSSKASAIDSIPDNQLPIRHTSTYHAVPADTGASARTDSIRAVRVSFRSTNGLTGDNERIAEVTRIIDMPNAGFGVMQTCGSVPILGTTVSGKVKNLGGGASYAVELTWNPATDETGGESDVVRYVIYRQTAPLGTEWGDPFLSIPAGKSSYSYEDGTVELGKTYKYALAAQDCTPSLSQLTETSTLIIP